MKTSSVRQATPPDRCRLNALTDHPKRELEYRIPRLHSPVNSRRSPETFEDFCKNKTSFLYVLVENRFLPLAPVDFRRQPETVPRTQVYIYLSLALSLYYVCMCMYIYIYIYTHTLIYVYT